MIKGAVSRPIFTAVVFVILLIIGGVSFKNLPVDIYPDIELPQISVLTLYPGASSENVEKLITKPLEDVLGNIQNLKEINSTSMENVSVVTLTFEYGTDLTEAVNDVRDAIDLAAFALPRDAEKPRILKFSASMMPLVIASVRKLNPGVNLKKMIDDKISPRLSRIDGVGGVDAWGGIRDIQVRVKVDRVKMENLGISLQQVVGALMANNMDVPLGSVSALRKEIPVRVPAEFKSLQDIENTIVGFKGRDLIYLKDIAEVGFEPEERINYQRLNGYPSAVFAVTKRSGANTVAVARKVKEEIKRLNSELKEIEVKVFIDNSKFIVSSISNLSRTIGFAILLVILVTFLMLNNFRASVIVATVIPVSLVVAFIFLFYSGGSLNIISLSAIAITIGMVVDNAIVVLENIFHHRERGESRREASIFGTQEVIQAIIASTITTIVIFLPLFLVKGLVGVLFRQLAVTVPLILATSLFTSMTLTPMLSSKFLKMTDKESKIEKWFRNLENGYKRLLKFSLRRKKLVLTLFLLLFVVGILLFRFIDTEFMPAGDTGYIRGEIELPLGTPLDVTNQMVGRIEGIIKSFPEVELYTARAGKSSSGFGAILGRMESSAYGSFSIFLKPKSKRKRTTEEVVNALIDTVKKLPGIKRVNFDVSGFTGPMGMEAPIKVSIFGHNISKLDSLAHFYSDRFEEIKGVLNTDISLKRGNPEIWFVPDREKLSNLGLTIADISSTLRSGIYGVEAGKLRREGEEFEIFVSLDDSSRKDPGLLQSLLVQTRDGRKIPIGTLGKVEYRYGAFSIQRSGGERVVYINLKLKGASPQKVVKKVKDVFEEYKLPAGMGYKIEGTIKDQAETFSTMFFAIVLGMVLVFLVMAAQFESFLDPFIIMFSIPFAITGVSLIFFFTGATLSLMGMVGMLMLIGIVVNNAIVLVDYTNLLRLRGREVHEAVVEGAARRLRPVLMTALTTIFGLLPLAIGRGEGSEMWAPLGISVIGGLVVSTFVTLILVPVLYSVFESRIRRRA